MSDLLYVEMNINVIQFIYLKNQDMKRVIFKDNSWINFRDLYVAKLL